MARPKTQMSRRARLLRLIGGVLDPRAWAHVLKVVNHYNYSHVRPLRRLARGEDVGISPSANFANAERIVLGHRVLVGDRCYLWAGHEGGWIRIGDDTMLAPGVIITASNYRFRAGAPISAQLMDDADVTIGRDVWLGARCIVLPGAWIGDGAVVGAGAVVRGRIPAGAIAAGAPARVVGSR